MSFHGGMTYSIQSESGKVCHVNGKRVRESRLNHGDEIQLGQDVLLKFLLPDPGSATALLEILKGYHLDDIRKILLLKGPGRDGRLRIGNASRVHIQTPKGDQIVDLYLEEPPDGSPPVLMAEAALRSAAPRLPWTIQPGESQVIELQYEKPDAPTALLTVLGYSFEIRGLR